MRELARFALAASVLIEQGSFRPSPQISNDLGSEREVNPESVIDEINSTQVRLRVVFAYGYGADTRYQYIFGQGTAVSYEGVGSDEEKYAVITAGHLLSKFAVAERISEMNPNVPIQDLRILNISINDRKVSFDDIDERYDTTGVTSEDIGIIYFSSLPDKVEPLPVSSIRTGDQKIGNQVYGICYPYSGGEIITTNSHIIGEYKGLDTIEHWEVIKSCSGSGVFVNTNGKIQLVGVLSKKSNSNPDLSYMFSLSDVYPEFFGEILPGRKVKEVMIPR